MEYLETTQKNIRGISIGRSTERAFYCMISIDTHTKQKILSEEAVGLVYVKALLAGCGKYSRESFLDAVNMLGASINIGVDNGIVSISLTSIDTNREKLLRIVRTMLEEPTFAPKEIARIIELTSNELEEDKENAKAQSLLTFKNVLYGKNDRRSTSSNDEVIRSLKLVKQKDVRNFHKHTMGSGWIYTIASETEAGQSTAAFLKKVRAQFTDAPETTLPQDLSKISNRKVELVSIPSKQNIELNIGGQLSLNVTQKDYYAFIFGLNVLGKWGGFAGRLMSTVREKEGLTYAIYAKTETASLTEYGYWRIMTFFSPDKVMQGVTSTLREIELIRKKGITETEYEQFKTILKTGYVLLNDSIIRIASEVHANQVKGLTYAEIIEHRKKMFDVTRDEVNQALLKYLDTSKLVIVGAGPTASKTKDLKALQSLE